MTSGPGVSVILPVYNGEKHVEAAVRSVLAQTEADWELLIVDDGSTDDTPAVLARFQGQPRLTLLRQDNRGPAAARNSGLRAARGGYVAFLDGDDEWLPGYLESIRSVAARHPEAAACYCSARCMDSDGRDLPQLAGVRQVAPEAMYATLLRANFLIPSTMLARRAAIVAAGLFDETRRDLDGCEDWDLWLRVARTQAIVGTGEALVRYRVHGGSLSVDSAGRRRAAAAVVDKHFGPDDGRAEAWSHEKRLAYGGLYRHAALTSLVRQDDWLACALHWRRALAADPSLANDLDFYYELALGAQPLGYRGTPQQLDLAGNAAQIRRALEQAFGAPGARPAAAARRLALGMAFYGLGLAAYNTRRLALSRRFLIEALRTHPGLWSQPRVIATLARACLGGTALEALKGRAARVKPAAELRR